MQSEDGAGQRSRGFDYLMDQGCAGFARQWVPGRDASMRRLQRLAERVEGYARKLDMEMEKEKYKC